MSNESELQAFEIKVAGRKAKLAASNKTMREFLSATTRLFHRLAMMEPMPPMINCEHRQSVRINTPKQTGEFIDAYKAPEFKTQRMQNAEFFFLTILETYSPESNKEIFEHITSNGYTVEEMDDARMRLRGGEIFSDNWYQCKAISQNNSDITQFSVVSYAELYFGSASNFIYERRMKILTHRLCKAGNTIIDYDQARIDAVASLNNSELTQAALEIQQINKCLWRPGPNPIEKKTSIHRLL